MWKYRQYARKNGKDDKIIMVIIAIVMILSVTLLSGCFRDIVIEPTTIYLTVYDNHTPVDEGFEEISGSPTNVFIYEYLPGSGEFRQYQDEDGYITLTKTGANTYEGSITVHVNSGKIWCVGFPSSNYLNGVSIKIITVGEVNNVELYHWNYIGN